MMGIVRTIQAIRTGALAIAVVAALAACGDGGGSGASPTTGPSATTIPSSAPVPIERPGSTAELKIVSPRNGAVLHGTTVDLRVRLDGARIVAQTTTDIAPDEGHVHVLLDDQLISMTEGLEQSIADVAPGMHRITVEFVASDHAPFNPRVVAVVAFEVQP